MASRIPDNVPCERRPMTRKEIKFFGTTLSFDEEAAIGSPTKTVGSPKFLRTQSSGMLSPKTGRQFFRSRDKNSNYDYGPAAVSMRSSSESLNSRGRSINMINKNASWQMMRRLKLVHESGRNDNVGVNVGDTDELDAACVCSGMQRSEKLHRLMRIRMARMRSRSASTDSWDDPNDKR